MKQQKQQALPEFTTDADGYELAHIALANSNQRATLYAEDYRRLIDAGFSRHWQYTKDAHGSAYVTLSAYKAQGEDRLVPVVRLIVGAKHGQRVRASDGNTRNLRKENLTLYHGAARHDAADWYPTATAARAARARMPTVPCEKTKPLKKRVKATGEAAAPCRPA